jgi:hypothetical protein
MNLTIIPKDNAVYKDGVCIDGLSIPMVPLNIHALQWNGVTGFIEYVADADGVRKQNEKITELPDWAVSAVAVRDAKQLELQEEAIRLQQEKERQMQEYEASIEALIASANQT